MDKPDIRQLVKDAHAQAVIAVKDELAASFERRQREAEVRFAQLDAVIVHFVQDHLPGILHNGLIKQDPHVTVYDGPDGAFADRLSYWLNTAGDDSRVVPGSPGDSGEDYFVVTLKLPEAKELEIYR
jgi:hypothetical protein